MEDINKPCATIRFATTEPQIDSLVTFESGASRIYFRQVSWDVPLFSDVACDQVSAALGYDAGGTITLDSGPASCTGGTIRQVFPVLLHHITGLAQDHMSCLVTFTSTTTADVFSCWYNSTEITPDWTSVLGYLNIDPVTLPAFLDARNASEIVVESGAFNVGGLPWRQGNQILLGEMDDFILAGTRHLA